MAGTMLGTQSKSVLGQSAAVVQIMGLGSQMPVTGVGTGSGGNTPASGVNAKPASTGIGSSVGGGGTSTQLLPLGQELPTTPPALATLPPAPPVPLSRLPVAAPDPTLVAPPVGAYA